MEIFKQPKVRVRGEKVTAWEWRNKFANRNSLKMLKNQVRDVSGSRIGSRLS